MSIVPTNIATKSADAPTADHHAGGCALGPLDEFGALTDWKETAKRSEGFVRQLDSHLAPIPIYLIRDNGTLRDYLAVGDHAAAHTNPFADLVARPYLESIGEWRGRGFAGVFKPAHPWNFLATVLHELAHFLSTPKRICELSEIPATNDSKMLRFDPKNNAIEINHEKFRAQLVSRADPAREIPPWADHGLLFIRALAHLCFRARQFVKFLALDQMYYAKHYGLSDAYIYWLLLEDECAANAEIPVREALAKPAPSFAVHLFARDTRAWDEKHRR